MRRIKRGYRIKLVNLNEKKENFREGWWPQMRRKYWFADGHSVRSRFVNNLIFMQA